MWEVQHERCLATDWQRTEGEAYSVVPNIPKNSIPVFPRQVLGLKSRTFPAPVVSQRCLCQEVGIVDLRSRSVLVELKLLIVLLPFSLLLAAVCSTSCCAPNSKTPKASTHWGLVSVRPHAFATMAAAAESSEIMSDGEDNLEPTLRNIVESVGFLPQVCWGSPASTFSPHLFRCCLPETL